MLLLGTIFLKKNGEKRCLVVFKIEFFSMKNGENPVKMEKNPVYEKWRKSGMFSPKKCRYLEIKWRRP